MAQSSSHTRLGFGSVLQLFLITLCISSAVLFIGFTIMNTYPQDFEVFYSSARTALDGGLIYDTYGVHNLPYWYFPWLAWFFLPIAIFPQQIGYAIFVVVSLVCAFVTIDYVIRKFVRDADRVERVYTFSLSLVICWLLFRVGQMDFVLLAVTVLMMHLIEKEKYGLAGLLMPILLFKPHLFAIFLPAALLKGGKRFLWSATLIGLILVAISFAVIPDWPLQMLRMLAESGDRIDHNWNFTTLPNMFGMQENWSGTANLPITIVLILTALAAAWKVKGLDTFEFLTIALAGSLFCAPRAYAYNLALLLPGMIWITSGLRKPLRLLFWLGAALVPFLFRFSSGTYSLVLMVFILGILKAHKELLHTSAPPQKTDA